MDGIAWASSAMIAARSRLEIATDNLANVSTDGFHAELARGTLSANGVQIVSVADREHGALRFTGRPYDLALVGDGTFRVRADDGRITATRNGQFSRDRFGVLRDDAGRALLGLHGALRVPDGARIDERGRVLLAGERIDRVLVSGGNAAVRSGFVETPNVNAIGEMVNVLAAQRSFESAEKVVSAIDGTRQKASNDVARLK